MTRATMSFTAAASCVWTDCYIRSVSGALQRPVFIWQSRDGWRSGCGRFYGVGEQSLGSFQGRLCSKRAKHMPAADASRYVKRYRTVHCDKPAARPARYSRNRAATTGTTTKAHTSALMLTGGIALIPVLVRGNGGVQGTACIVPICSQQRELRCSQQDQGTGTR